MDFNEHMKLFHEIFDASLPRLGPGDDASTIKALKKLYPANPGEENIGPAKLKVLDIGCGNGAQTIQLATHLDCKILAVDNHGPFLQELERRAKDAGVAHKITTSLKDMGELSRDDGTFDLIWSEGALNLMGFSEGELSPTGFGDGLALCHELVRPGGAVVLSELCWFRDNPPAECKAFFDEAFPYMETFEEYRTLMESVGFNVIDSFTLPESSWWDNYLDPLEKRIRSLRERYEWDEERLAFMDMVGKEMHIYREYSSFYGYGFFVMRK